MDKKTMTAQIRAYMIEKHGMDLFGVAPASAFDAEPEGFRPNDILHPCKSVIVYGRRLLNGAVQAQFRRLEDKTKSAQSIYSTYGLELIPNWTMVLSTFYLTQYLETTFDAATQPLGCGPEQGGLPKKTALPMFAGPYKGGLPFNVAHAAIAAGLAQPGWNNFPVTKEFGPRVQFGCLLTDLELEYNEPDNGPRLCDPDKCHICSDKCPMNALPPKSSGKKTIWTIAGKDYEVAEHKVNACTVAALGMRSEFAGIVDRGDLVEGMDPTDDDIAAAMKKYPLSNSNLDHYPKNFCNRCQVYCPIGNWKETFADTGLSKG